MHSGVLECASRGVLQLKCEGNADWETASQALSFWLQFDVQVNRTTLNQGSAIESAV